MSLEPIDPETAVDLNAIAAREVNIQEGRTHSRKEIKAKYGCEVASDR
ncbi:hypothetical protein [Halorubrum persicum]|nr:hypothetical protein [Halorubrum persicum]